MKKSVIYFGIIVLFVSLLSSCSEEAPRQKFKHVETIDLDRSFINLQTIIEGDAHTGKKFSRADVGNNFGLGYSYLIPDTLKGKDLLVTINAWVRTGDLGNNCDVILSSTSNDSILLWTGCSIKDFLRNPNEWTTITKSVVVPAAVTSKNNAYINVIGHNIDAKSFLDIDDLVIEYKEIESEKEAE